MPSSALKKKKQNSKYNNRIATLHEMRKWRQNKDENLKQHAMNEDTQQAKRQNR